MPVPCPWYSWQTVVRWSRIKLKWAGLMYNYFISPSQLSAKLKSHFHQERTISSPPRPQSRSPYTTLVCSMNKIWLEGLLKIHFIGPHCWRQWGSVNLGIKLKFLLKPVVSLEGEGGSVPNGRSGNCPIMISEENNEEFYYRQLLCKHPCKIVS